VTIDLIDDNEPVVAKSAIGEQGTDGVMKR
jgi:hypothetical protein